MKIQFVSISIEGFLSIGNKSLVDLTRDGITIVHGINKNPSDNAKSNGSGKSSIFEAIYFALTGTTIRGIKGKDVVNRNYPVGCCVELTLIRGNDVFQVIRSRNHQINGTSVRLIMNGDDVSGKSMKDSGDLIHEYLPELSSNIIGSILILGQGLPHKLTRYSPSGRKSLLEELSGTGATLNELGSRIDARKRELQDAVREYERGIDQSNASIQSYQRIVDDTVRTIESYNADAVQEEITKWTNRAEEQKALIAQMDLGAREVDGQIQNYTRQLSDCAQMIGEADAVIRGYKRDIDRMGSGICPTCKRPFENANEMKLEKEKLTQKLAEIQVTRNEYQSAYDSVKSVLDERKSVYQGYLTNKKEMTSALTESTSKLAVLNNTMSVVSKSVETLEKYTALIDECKKMVAELQSAREVIDSQLKSVGYLDRAVSKEFKTYMLSSVIEYLNNRACYYASKFFTEGRMKIYASGNSIEIEVGSKPYESLSGGEAQKADLAIQFAMRDMLVAVTGLHCNMLVLDEVFDNLDEIGCNSLLDILSMDLASIDSVYVITHHSDIEVPYDHEIEVVKNEIELSEIYQITR